MVEIEIRRMEGEDHFVDRRALPDQLHKSEVERARFRWLREMSFIQAQANLSMGKYRMDSLPGRFTKFAFAVDVQEIDLKLQLVAHLNRLEAIAVLPPEPPPESLDEAPIEDGLSTTEIVHYARKLLEVGNAPEAEEAARKAHALSASAETAELLRQAESALLAQLRQELMSAKVPSLLVSAADLKDLQLSAPEKYLLSRVNGTRQLASIVNASPIQELEALKSFHRFVQSGLVKLA